jgi:UDP-2,3-diacylglucosamine pyrophosphatase LpxH
LIKNNDCFEERFEVNSAWKKRILLTSDIHFDSIHCDRKMLKRHFDEAKEKDADIWIFGDLFDAMGGKFDLRSNKASIRDEHQVADYFNKIVEEFAEFAKPYADNIKFISMGNHEQSILRRHEIGLLNVLNYLLGNKIAIGNYWGWIRLLFHRDLKRRADSSLSIYYNHGQGGDTKVTKGTIRATRRDQMIDADMYISGHTHQGMLLPVGKRKLNLSGKEVTEWRQHIMLKTYQDDSDFQKEQENLPHLTGAVWLELGINQQVPNYVLWDAK